MFGRRSLLVLLVAGFWAGSPIGLIWPDEGGQAAWAKQGGSGSGSGNSGGGSGSSGSGSGNDDDDDDDDHDDDDDDHSGSGSSGSGKSGKGRGNADGAATGKGLVPDLGGDGIHVQFSDGHIERIRSGRFEKVDKSGRLIERRGATAKEERRLRALAAGFAAKGRASGIVTIADIDGRSGRIEITDFRGWRETLSTARYELSDPNGRTVSRRALTPDDVARVRSFLFLD